MRYCTKCVYPDTKPHLTFSEDGICSSCTAFEARRSIDWTERKAAFEDIASRLNDEYPKLPYNCIIPVSGGKDSTWQVLKALSMGLRPLAVTAMTDDLSPIGWRNLNNISKLGVDHVMVQVDQKLRRRLNALALELVGDISWPEHVLIFTVPIAEAARRGIPVVFYGECPENEYGGPPEAQNESRLKQRWLQEFGGLNGLRVSDLPRLLPVEPPHKWAAYQYPDAPDVSAYFMGYFFPWDGARNADIAARNGFEIFPERIRGAFFTYENLDNYQTGLHDYFKYLKFGYGRVTDHVCTLIKRGVMTRAEAVEKVNTFDGEFPTYYLGKPYTDILADIKMDKKLFFDIVDKFKNKELFDDNDDRIGMFQRKFECA